MIPLFSTKQVKEVDDFAINHLGIPAIVLMENASLEIYKNALEKISQKKFENSVGFICGKGNNGGDGFAAARHFANNGFKVTVVYLGSENELSKDCKINFNILKQSAKTNKNISLKKYSTLKDLNILKNCSVIFDAMLGTGITGDLREPYQSIIKYLNELKSYKIAVDIPTGLDADKGFTKLSFIADLTITLGEFKSGLFFEDGYSYAGEVVKGNIGVSYSIFDKYSTENYLIEPEDAYNFLPKKSKSINKYSAGKVLTIAGSEDLPGAAVLASTAALKTGAGASILCFPNSVKNLAHKNLSEVIVHSYEDNSSGYFSIDNLNEISEKLEWADVLAIGPGLGRNEETQQGILEILKRKTPSKIVIDADAIFALANGKYKKIDLKNFILTPHHGEFANLIGIEVNELKSDLLKFGKEFVKETKSFLVLKGAPTIIFTPTGEALINTTGNPGMAKFGTGDVLTGAIAGMISQGKNNSGNNIETNIEKNIERGIIAAVYFHSLAADLLVNDYTEFGYTAKDILNDIPFAINFVRKSIV
ncbi:MAG: NAD(P)H-hydrate dehydratase [Ignavibacteriaceae bacterium]